ncbi:MAG: hypothetical protein L6R42_001127 [Xanthoria sp. 1 TBL-2021]|nr:MAG: hypothetical protein L6R42_001127 [Xanthoria sp. 1 TBL-2021]
MAARARAASGQHAPTLERHAGINGELQPEEDTFELSMEDLSNFVVEGSPLTTPAWPTISDVHRALRPLQAEADRVGKQVEQFAETLDRLTNDTRGKPQNDCTHALKLVHSYRKIARSTVQYLREIHAPEKQEQASVRPESKTPNSYRDSAYSTATEDLERWQQEEQTWHLLGVMLQVQYPSSETQQVSSKGYPVRPSKEREINHYSSESDVWSRFLADDDQAWERHSVVEWLKTCAMESGPAIEEVVEKLETDADRGSGLCAHSWLYTKEAIKGQKRLRSWPQALAPDSPGIDASLRNADRSKSLVTQLDPDAATRQARGLEHQDENYERATWLACWEMVRRGQDWDSIRVWCQDRVESWRAIALCGDPRHHLSNDCTDPGSGAAAGWQSRALWRKVCALAAQSDGADKFEAAVYGAVSGHLPSMKKVCCSWNDYLFAHYNCQVLGAFDEYITRSFSNRLPNGLHDKAGLFNVNMTSANRAKSGNHLMTSMRELKTVSEEAKGPFKMLQGSLIGKTFDEFVRNNGALLFQTMSRLGRSKNYTRFLRSLEKAQAEGKVQALIKPDDYQIIRIVTHICLIFEGLGAARSKDVHSLGTENFLDAYISFLGSAGKQQLLPLYASFLSRERAISCMAREIRIVVEHGERQTMMRLMKQYKLDLPRVLNKQLRMSMKKSEDNEEKDPGYPKLSILDSKKLGEMRTIKNGFMGFSITDNQHDLINGFEWYLLLEDYWEETLAIGALLYRYLFKLAGSKGLAAAKEISKRVTFSTLCQRRGDSRSMKDGQAGKGQCVSKRSDTFQNLEQLVHALSALEAWQAEVKKKPRDLDMSSPMGKKWRDSLRKASESVEAHIQPLLRGWLQYSQDESEALELEQIREACLPEVLLAYTAILNYSSQYLSRSYLLKSMELGATIAAPDSDLAGCFVSSKRMPEMVDALAVTSMNMLVAEEYGIGNKKMSAKMGLWSSKGS